MYQGSCGDVLVINIDLHPADHRSHFSHRSAAWPDPPRRVRRRFGKPPAPSATGIISIPALFTRPLLLSAAQRRQASDRQRVRPDWERSIRGAWRVSDRCWTQPGRHRKATPVHRSQSSEARSRGCCACATRQSNRRHLVGADWPSASCSSLRAGVDRQECSRTPGPEGELDPPHRYGRT